MVYWLLFHSDYPAFMHSLAFSFPFSVSLTKDVPASKKLFYLCFYCQECPSPCHFLPHAPVISITTTPSSLFCFTPCFFTFLTCSQTDASHRWIKKKNIYTTIPRALYVVGVWPLICICNKLEPFRASRADLL